MEKRQGSFHFHEKGQIKRFFILLAIVAGLLLFLWLTDSFWQKSSGTQAGFQASEVQTTERLKPVRSFVGSSGEAVDVYSGIVTGLKAIPVTYPNGNTYKNTVITLTSDGKSADFFFPADQKLKIVNFKDGKALPTIGINDKVRFLYVHNTTSREPYIGNIVVER